MTKKEIAEIKKLYQKDTGVITRVCGCYVGDEKDKIATFGEAFYSLQEEDSFKYYDIFKKTLSGTVGKNLLDLEFPLMSESPGGTQEFLFRLKNSELKDEELLLEFYDKIIENFSYVGNYLILLIHNAYDVPGIAKDGRSMEDASEEVYSFLLCSVCPVNLSKPGLSYHSERNLFQNASREWLADPPAIGFLFPAFEDRSTDLHRVLYYTKNADELQAEFVSNVLGAVTPMPLSGQRESFYSLVEEALGEKRDYQTLIGIQETIQEKIEESADEPQPLILNKKDVEQILSDNGAPEERMERFDEIYEEIMPKDSPILAANVVNAKKCELKMPNITVSVKAECTHLLETKLIDGRNCLVIALEDRVEVNGIPLYDGAESRV